VEGAIFDYTCFRTYCYCTATVQFTAIPNYSPVRCRELDTVVTRRYRLMPINKLYVITSMKDCVEPRVRIGHCKISLSVVSFRFVGMYNLLIKEEHKTSSSAPQKAA